MRDIAMLLEKYEPKSTRDIIGNSLQINAIRDFLKRWEHGRALFLFGPTGTGKTIAIRLIAKELDYQIFESHADDERTNRTKDKLISISKQEGMLYKKRIILFDEAESIESTKILGEIIAESMHPVVIIGENPYDRKFFGIRKYLKIVKFQKPGEKEIFEFLIKICKHEGVEIEKRDINQLARMCNGDIRSALIDLEILKILGNIKGIEHREQVYDIFNLLKIIFKSTSIKNIRTALDNCESPENLIAWIEENITNEFHRMEDIANAYNYLSKADLFRSRILNRQSWSLQKYYYNLSTLGLIKSKKQTASFVRYNPPAFYFTQNNRTVMEKIGNRLHISRKRAREYVPLLKTLMKSKNGKEIANAFGFEDDEIESVRKL